MVTAVLLHARVVPAAQSIPQRRQFRACETEGVRSACSIMVRKSTDFRGSDAGRELQLVLAAQQGDERACCDLVRKYRGLIRYKARTYYLVGADRDDIIQEGMIGLYKAMRDYDPTRQASFHSFADLCVTRQIITAVKSATRRKHSPLNGYVSLSRSTSMEEDGERLLSDILAAKGVCDPAEIVVAAWETDFIRSGVAEALSSFEAEGADALHQRALVPGDRRHARQAHQGGRQRAPAGQAQDGDADRPLPRLLDRRPALDVRRCS